MKHTKISIIGAGSVGSTIAYALLLKNIGAEIVLVDTNELRCRGEVLDLSDSLSFCGPSQIRAGIPSDAQNSDIIVIAAGKKQEPGQKRKELLEANKRVADAIIDSIQPLSKESIVIVVTNPVDLITRHIQQKINLPVSQVFGSGTFLDSMRLRGEISKKTGIAEQSIHAYILGEHGEKQFPAWSAARIAGIPLSDFGISQTDLDQMAHNAKNRAYEIISCKGATYYGIATCIAALCRTIIFDQKRVTPLSVYLEQLDVTLSMPVVLGRNGIERVLDIPLTAQEEHQFAQAIEEFRKNAA